MTTPSEERIRFLFDVLSASIGACDPTPGEAVWQAAIYLAQEAVKVPGLGPEGRGYLFGWWDDVALWPFSKELQSDIREVKSCDRDPLSLAIFARSVPGGERLRSIGIVFERDKDIALYPGSFQSLIVVPSDLWATWLAKVHFLVAKRGQPWWDVVERIAYEHKDDPLFTPTQIEGAITIAVKELQSFGWLESDRQWIQKPGGK